MGLGGDREIGLMFSAEQYFCSGAGWVLAWVYVRVRGWVRDMGGVRIRGRIRFYLRFRGGVRIRTGLGVSLQLCIRDKMCKKCTTTVRSSPLWPTNVLTKMAIAVKDKFI